MKSRRANKKEINNFLSALKKSMVAQIEWEIKKNAENGFPPYQECCENLINAVAYVKSDANRSKKGITKKETPITLAIQEGVVLACDAIFNNILINCKHNKEITEMCEKAKKRFNNEGEEVE
jgi:hypothetical protein